MNEDEEQLRAEIEAERRLRLQQKVTYYQKRDSRVFKSQYSDYYPSTLKRQEMIAGRPRPSVCEICGRSGRITFDHCHNTGAFRGWICFNCNVLLGHANDDPELLERLAAYLRISVKGTDPSPS